MQSQMSVMDKQFLKARCGKKHKVIQTKPFNYSNEYSLVLACFVHFKSEISVVGLLFDT